MPITQVVHVMMPPERWLEITAPDVTTAIDAARHALPHFCSTEEERGEARLLASDIRYTLTCLFCGTRNPTHQGTSSLIAMQEHLIEQHGLSQEQFQGALRVFTGITWEGQYIWLVPPDGDRGSLPFMRASRYTTAARAFSDESEQGERKRLFSAADLPQESRMPGEIALQSSTESERESVFRVAKAGEDSLAWYGYPRECSWTWSFLVWPRQEWQEVPL